MLGAAMVFAQRVLGANWAEIVARVPQDLLPRQAASGKRFEEYGCGHYGCVLPTARPNVVVKVTTDPTEIAFVTRAMQFGEWPAGIVRYFEILPLAGTYRNRPIVLIWREEAWHVGRWLPTRLSDGWVLPQADPPKLDDYTARARVTFAGRLAQFKLHASYVREGLKRARNPHESWLQAKQLAEWAWRNIGYDALEEGPVQFGARAGSAFLRGQHGAYAIAARLRACEIVAEMMANEPEGYLVGQALEFYLERGLLLADVHEGNIGEVPRQDHTKPVLVITDPGHAVVLG